MVDIVKNYIKYLENSWLLFTMSVYDYSVKRQQIAAKKMYCIDTGLAEAIGFAFSTNGFTVDVRWLAEWLLE
jgi:predicted AAA+ superfamily ATPase